MRVIGNEQEVGRTLATQNRILLAYVRRRLATAVDAEDVAQEAILRVLARARDTLIADPLFYAMRAARNILVDRARRAASVQIDDLEAAELSIHGGATPLEALDMSERSRLCQRALEAMPPLRREVFVRRRAGEESYEAIARDLKLSIEAVQKHYSRAAQTLRRTAEGRHVD
nr:sigma-70 family RNA polymerase sigma factor [Caulobacter hibisci]